MPLHEEDRPQRRRPDLDKLDRHARDKSRKKRKKAARMPTWVMLTTGAILAIVLAAGGFFAFHMLNRSKDNSSIGTSEESQSLASGEGENRAQSKPKYIPRVSEQKLEQFFKNRNPWDVTEEEVYAIMGEPTRRDVPVTGRKNGMVFTVYKAYWEEPGSGVKSSIAFANGRVSGMILGLETSSPKPGGRE